MSSIIQKIEQWDNAIRPESPLHHIDSVAADESTSDVGVVLCEKKLLTHLTLRGAAENTSLNKGVKELLEVDLPHRPGTYTESQKARISWQGPDEWLIVTEQAAEEVEAKLRAALQGHFSLVDVSGGQTIFNISGPQVGALLKKSSAYDFHPDHFGEGRCVSTTFAKTTALVTKNPDDSFDLVVRRSFSDYLFQWIEDASREYGFAYKG